MSNILPNYRSSTGDFTGDDFLDFFMDDSDPNPPGLQQSFTSDSTPSNVSEGRNSRTSVSAISEGSHGSVPIEYSDRSEIPSFHAVLGDNKVKNEATVILRSIRTKNQKVHGRGKKAVNDYYKQAMEEYSAALNTSVHTEANGLSSIPQEHRYKIFLRQDGKYVEVAVTPWLDWQSQNLTGEDCALKRFFRDKANTPSDDRRIVGKKLEDAIKTCPSWDNQLELQLREELDAYDKIKDLHDEAASLVRRSRSLTIRKLWDLLLKSKKKRPRKDSPMDDSNDHGTGDGGQSGQQKRYKSDKGGNDATGRDSGSAFDGGGRNEGPAPGGCCDVQDSSDNPGASVQDLCNSDVLDDQSSDESLASYVEDDDSEMTDDLTDDSSSDDDGNDDDDSKAGSPRNKLPERNDQQNGDDGRRQSSDVPASCAAAKIPTTIEIDQKMPPNVISVGHSLKSDNLPEVLTAMMEKERTIYFTVDYFSSDFQLPLQPSQLTSTLSFSKKSESSNQMTARWREKMCDWAYQVVNHFQRRREVVAYCFNYVDRYIARTGVPNDKTFALIVATCLYLAIKVKENVLLTMATFVNLSRGTFKHEEMVDAERIILGRLDFHLLPPTAFAFVGHFLNYLADQDNEIYTAFDNIFDLAAYLTELSIFDHFFVEYFPSDVAKATIVIAVAEQSKTSVDELLENAEVQNCFNRLQQLFEQQTGRGPARK